MTLDERLRLCKMLQQANNLLDNPKDEAIAGAQSIINTVKSCIETNMGKMK